MRYTGNVKRFLLAPVMMIAIVFGVIGVGYALKPDTAKAETEVVLADCTVSLGGLPIGKLCLDQSGKNAVVRLDGTTILSIPLENVQLPPVTINVPQTVRVTLPRVTVTRPPVTVKLPGVTVPGRTVTINLPGATKTVTLPVQTVDGGVGTITPKPQVAVVTVKGPNGQDIRTSVTITPSPAISAVTTKPVVKERKIKVSIPQAIGIGLGVLILGLVLGLLAIYVAYAAGYKDSETAEKAVWRKFRDDVFGRKEKGDK